MVLGQLGVISPSGFFSSSAVQYKSTKSPSKCSKDNLLKIVVFTSHVRILPCKAKRQYPITLQVSIYCLLDV